MLDNIDVVELLNFAIAGINSEIEKTEKKIVKGNKILNGEFKSNRSKEKIKQVISLKKDHIEDLKKLKDVYTWKLGLIEQKRN